MNLPIFYDTDWENKQMNTNNHYFKLVGSCIAEMLARKSLTPHFLAERLNVPEQIIQQIIIGQKAVNMEELTNIVSTMGFSYQDFLDTLVRASESRSVFPSNNTYLHFMSDIQNPDVAEDVQLLMKIIDEILFLEDYANGFHDIKPE